MKLIKMNALLRINNIQWAMKYNSENTGPKHIKIFIYMCSMCTLLVTRQMSWRYRNLSQAYYNITALTSAITCESCPHKSAKNCSIKRFVNIIFYTTPQNKSHGDGSAGLGGQRLQPLSPMWLCTLMLQCSRTHKTNLILPGFSLHD
jgi:hypothetical protein